MDVKRFRRNWEGKDYFVGDIHGCFLELTNKMLEVGFDTTVDRIFSVGDLVDRGVNSLQSVDWIKLPYFHAVQGNHESLAIRYPNGNMDTDIVKNIDYVVAGHTPLTKPVKLGNVFYIDTGCVFGRELTFKTIDELIEGVI